MDEGSFVFNGLIQNQDGDFLFVGNSLRRFMSTNNTPKKVVSAVDDLLKQKDTSINEIINTLNDASVFLFEKGYLFWAIEFCKRVIFYCKISEHNEIKFKCLRRIGDSFYHVELDKDAIHYYKQALPLAIQLKNKDYISLIHYNMAQTYNSLKQTTQAITHYEQALSMANETSDVHSIKSQCKEHLEELCHL